MRSWRFSPNWPQPWCTYSRLCRDLATSEYHHDIRKNHRYVYVLCRRPGYVGLCAVSSLWIYILYCGTYYLAMMVQRNAFSVFITLESLSWKITIQDVLWFQSDDMICRDLYIPPHFSFRIGCRWTVFWRHERSGTVRSWWRCICGRDTHQRRQASKLRVGNVWTSWTCRFLSQRWCLSTGLSQKRNGSR